MWLRGAGVSEPGGVKHGGGVNEVGDVTLDDRGAEEAGAVGAALEIERVLDDVVDLANNEADGESGFLIHDNAQRAVARCVGGRAGEEAREADERENLAAVLNGLASSG